MIEPVQQAEVSLRVIQADCIEAMREMPDNSVDLILTDPPYFRVKDEPWDRVWKSADSFIEWLGLVANEWQRALKPNGSLYCFAGPRLSGRVETMLGQRFNVLNRIRWVKEAGWHKKAKTEEARRYLSPWEEVIFAEQYGADGSALSGWVGKCEELRGFVFEPLRQYIVSEFDRAGVKARDIAEILGVSSTMIRQHYLSCSQWELPTEKAYRDMREALSILNSGGKYLSREYEDLRREYEDLRREYEGLRREYEGLRRPFSLNGLTEDVWRFRTVSSYPGKHPCEKPLDMMEHIIKVSSREGDTVLDCFAGSGVTLQAALNLGREAIGIEQDEWWANKARQRAMSHTTDQLPF